MTVEKQKKPVMIRGKNTVDIFAGILITIKSLRVNIIRMKNTVNGHFGTMTEPLNAVKTTIMEIWRGFGSGFALMVSRTGREPTNPV